MKRKGEVIAIVAITFIVLGWITGGAIVYQNINKGIMTHDDCQEQRIVVPIWLNEKCVPSVQVYKCNEVADVELIQCDFFEGTVIKNKLPSESK